ncbi:MAG: bifunctional metallophosphatase/5'-nucleotidase [Bacteroidaceae bacterium]|nr:bifunctional metallophosphatase/5'-nucleotidase [Bacteroidaceae bacterium]
MKKILSLFFGMAISTAAMAQDADIKILGINDMHAAVQNFPKFAHIVDSIRSLHPDVLLMAAGDNRTGNPINDMHETPNLPMVEMMNAVGFNASTMGNHECDHSAQNFAYTINESQFPYIVANAYPNDTLKLHFQPFRLFEHQGVRIGVIGFVQVNQGGTPDCLPSKVDGIRFADPFKEADKYKWLRNQCDVYIALNHIGLENDTLFADAHPEFDLMICGHSHDIVPGIIRNGVMIAQAKRDVKYVNEIDLKVRGGKVVEKKCKLIDVCATKGENARLKAMLEKFSDNPILNKVVGHATTPFKCREELGSMMADADMAVAKADLSIVNAGSVRYETKDAGAFNVNDVLRLDPFGNTLYVVELTGLELKALLEELPTTDEYGPGYAAGFQYTIVADKKGKYVVKEMKTADGKKFNMQKTYKVAMDNFVYQTNTCMEGKPFTETYMKTSDALIQFLEIQPAVDYKGVKRVTIVGGTHR